MAITPVSTDMAIVAALSDLPNATDGLTAAQLKAKFDEGGTALKTYINDTLIPALEATTDGSSGADQIGATSVTDLTGNTVQALIESLKDYADSLSMGAVSDGAVTNAKLATDVKVGSLAALTTTDKSSVVAAVNEHLAVSASESVKGHVELATAAETTTGTDDTRAVHPAGLKVELDKKLPLTAGSGNPLTGALYIQLSSQNLFFTAGSDATTTADIDFPDVSTAGVNVRLFRTTNTSGTRSLEIYKGDGSNDPVFTLNAGTGIITLDSGTTHGEVTGSPEGAVTAPVGSTRYRIDGASGTTLYTKVSGTGNTGWEVFASA